MSMTLISPECVSPEEIALYHVGDVTPDRTLEIDRHIYSCAYCRGLANEMADIVQQELEAHMNVLPAPAAKDPVRFLMDVARAVPRFISSIRPAEALQPGLVFAPDTAEAIKSGQICYLNDDLRWSAPIESGIQYIYVETTGPASVLLTLTSSRPNDFHEEAVSVRVAPVRVPVRGTKFEWRVSHCMGPVEQLIDRYGRDYQITVTV